MFRRETLQALDFQKTVFTTSAEEEQSPYSTHVELHVWFFTRERRLRGVLTLY